MLGSHVLLQANIGLYIGIGLYRQSLVVRACARSSAFMARSTDFFNVIEQMFRILFEC